MKKFIAVFLSLVMVLSFAACGSSNTDDVRGDITSGNPDTSSDKTASEKEFSVGSTSENSYKNEFLGIGCELDSGWTFYTDTQIAELNNIATDMLGEEYAEQVAAADIIYDMFATDASGNNIYVILQKVNALGAAFNDVEDYVDASITTVKESLVQAGATVENCEKVEVTFAGEKTYAIYAVSNISGVNLYQKQVYLKKGSYVVMLTITAVNEDITDSLISKFYALGDSI